jgi:hypothetical protein
MSNLTHDEIRARQRQYRESLIVLNSNRERNRLLFWVALVVGLLVLIIFTATIRILWMGLAVVAPVELLLGVPGFIGWQRAESKIARIQAELAVLERTGVGNQKTAVNAARPNPLKIPAAHCKNCGIELVGAGAFCQSCGAKQ